MFDSGSHNLSLSLTVSHPHSFTLRGPSGLGSVSRHNAKPCCEMKCCFLLWFVVSFSFLFFFSSGPDGKKYFFATWNTLCSVEISNLSRKQTAGEAIVHLFHIISTTMVRRGGGRAWCDLSSVHIQYIQGKQVDIHVGIFCCKYAAEIWCSCSHGGLEGRW